MGKNKIAQTAWNLATVLGACLLCMAAQAQAPGTTSSTPGTQGAYKTTASGPSTATDSSPIANAQQNLYEASGQNGAQPSQDSFKGSVVQGSATGTVIDLSLDDAIQRGLKANLGLILQNSAQSSANGQRLEQLQALLPTATGAASINVQQVNLAAYGLKFPGLNPIVGPFQAV